MATPFEEVTGIREAFGGLRPPQPREVTITGSDPVFSTRFKIAEAVPLSWRSGIAVSDIWEMKTGRRLGLSVDVRRVAAGLRSPTYLQRPGPDGAFKLVVNKNHQAMRAITQPWPTKDGRWVLPHFGLPNLQARMLKLLGCDPNAQSVAKAVASWDALDLEAAIDEAGVCGGMVRSNEDWLFHPHGRVLAAKPIVEIIRIGESYPEPLPKGGRPLTGVRALVSHPHPGRTDGCAHAGRAWRRCADGDRRASATYSRACPRYQPRQAQLLPQSWPQGGCRAHESVDTRGRCLLAGLSAGSDQQAGLRARRGRSARPGIIYASINCYGADGPFSHRGGWEQEAQTMTGLCHEGQTGERPDGPADLPAAACEYTTGYLAAYGIVLALARRARDGGSYHVRVSLCQSGMFIYRQGKVAFPGPDLDLAAQLDGCASRAGPRVARLRHLGPILKFSEAQPHWSRPTPQLGGDAPEWNGGGAPHRSR